MKKVAYIAVLSLFCVVVGCVPSLHSYFKDKDVVENDAIVGKWISDEGETWAFSEGKDSYQLVYTDKDGKAGGFHVVLFKLDGALLMDVQPMAIEEQGPKKEFNWLYSLYTLEGHALFKVIDVDGDGLSMAIMNPEYVAKLIEKNPKIIAHAKVRQKVNPKKSEQQDLLVLTAKTEELQGFVEKLMGDDDFWGEPLELEKVNDSNKERDEMVKRDENGLVAVGSKAPAFKVKDQDGTVVSLAEFKGKKNVVLIFYPGDSTPGCTKQLCAVRDDYADFKAADVAVFGVNHQSAESHKRFIEKQNYPFPLLVDDKHDMMTKYGCNNNGRAKRTVYGIDKDGVVVFAQSGMPSDAEILAAFN